MYTLLCQHDRDLYIKEVSNHPFEHSWIRFKMAGFGSIREQNIEARLVEASEILELKETAGSVNDEDRKNKFIACVNKKDSPDTRCLVVLVKGFGDRTHFWERQRTKNQSKLENEACTYNTERGYHAEAYVLARLELYMEAALKKQTVDSEDTEDVAEKLGKMKISKKVIIYLTREPCNNIEERYFNNPNSKSCLKRILEFSNVYDDIEIEINYVHENIYNTPKQYEPPINKKTYISDLLSRAFIKKMEEEEMLDIVNLKIKGK